MIYVVVVRLKVKKGIYYVSPNMLELVCGDLVVFETENGLQLGEVCKNIYEEKAENLDSPLPKVIRVATSEDLMVFDENLKAIEKALYDAKKISKELELDMNFVEAYYNLDKSQLVFSFLSDNRVDFRELAKKLAQRYKTRIELRQIGVRDKSKKVGGLGPCGLFLCCNSFLTDFNSVSINMAKNQFLALNPSKINGVCGRLLCCLGYENDVYTYDLSSNVINNAGLALTYYVGEEVVENGIYTHALTNLGEFELNVRVQYVVGSETLELEFTLMLNLFDTTNHPLSFAI